MLSILKAIGHVIDVALLLPIGKIIEAVVAVIYYFLATSWLIGYCLVQAGFYTWSTLCDCYQLLIIIYQEVHVFYYEMRNIACNVTDYVYDGTGDGLRLGHNVAKYILLGFNNLLIGLGNCTLWILMLLPRGIIFVVDYVIHLLEKLGFYMFERGLILLNNIFLLCLGIAVLMVIYTFRGYIVGYAAYLLRKLFNELSIRARDIWTVPNFYWLFDKISKPSSNQHSNDASLNRQNCVVCMERSRTIVILPCRHLCLCRECSQQLHRCENSNRCPICRRFVDTLMAVYS